MRLDWQSFSIFDPSRRLKTNRRPREQSIYVHRDGAGGEQVQSIITIAPVFDERNIWIGEGGSGGHIDMILQSETETQKILYKVIRQTYYWTPKLTYPLCLNGKQDQLAYSTDLANL